MSASSVPTPLPAADGGPSNVIRHGGTVLRPAVPSTGTVHALLRHLERVGFTGSPRVAGAGHDGEGRDALDYLEGTVDPDRVWTDDGIWQLGSLLRALHRATADFRPPDATWPSWWMHRDAPGSVIGHCDVGPWHVVARDGRPVAFIDWTLAGPVDPLDEVAVTGWWNAHLVGDDVADRHGLPGPVARARMFRLFLDGYGVAPADRVGLVGRMIDLAVLDCADEAARAHVTPGSADPAPLWALAWRAGSAAWMIDHRSLLERAVGY